MDMKDWILANVLIDHNREQAEAEFRHEQFDGFTSYRPGKDWVDGRLSYRQRIAISAALKELESEGLIICERDNTGACRWVKLSDEGMEKAIEPAEQLKELMEGEG